MRSIVVSVVLAVALSFVVGEARAEGERRAAVTVEGKRAAKLRKPIARVLSERGYRIVDVGLSGAAAPEDYVSRAREARLTTVVEASTSRAGRLWKIHIVVRDGATGEVVAEQRFAARTVLALRRTTYRRMWKRIGRRIARTSAPPPPEVADDAPSEADETPPPGTDDGAARDVAPAPSGTGSADASVSASVQDSRGTPAVTLAVGVRLLSRRLGYNDELFDTLRGYEIPVLAAPSVRASWFPLAQWGIEGSFARSAPFESRSLDAEGYPTRMTEYAVGLRHRRTLGGARLRAEVDYGAHDFVIDRTGDMPPAQVPDMRYRYARAGLAASMATIGRLRAGAAAGYRHLLSIGEITSEDYFPRGTAAGIDAAAWLRYPVVDTIDVRLTGELERYFYTLNPEPGDPHIAGGAIDQYLGARIELGMSF